MEVTTIMNHDILGLTRRISQFITEIRLSNSASASAMQEADGTRINAYLGEMKSHKGWIFAEPQLDTPKTHPHNHEAPTAVDQTAVKNEHINDLVLLFAVMRDELLGSQSADLGAGLLPADGKRFDIILAKMESLMAHVKNVGSLDRPESLPASG